MEVRLVPIDSINPYERNPRLNDAAVDAVAASLLEFGFRQPIVVDKDGVIVVGHTRWRAAKKLGLAEVPVHAAADLTPEQCRAYRLADNATQDLAEWNMDLLRQEAAALVERIDLSQFGMTPEMLAAFEAGEIDAPALADGDRAPFQQMTFTLSDEQAESVKAAMAKASEAGPFVDTGNENSNGNALARIAEAYNG